MEHVRGRCGGSGVAGWTAAALATALVACGGSQPLSPASSGPRIELQGTPAAAYDAATGRTTVTLEFLVRDSGGNSVDPSTVKVARYVDGRPADAEAITDSSDTRLGSSLDLGLVLDASYSMTTWQPPAFGPMKQAALDMQQSIRAQFASWNPGGFTSSVSWFQDRYVCSPSTALPDAAVLDIPTPAPGDATKLFAATAQAVDRLSAQYAALSAPTSSDNFGLVVFTDGYDNLSWHDDSTAPATSYPTAGGSFSCVGPGPVSLADLLAKIKAFPQLTVHVIGIGNQINASELGAIAAAGHGRFVSNPDSREVSALFAEITREFTTVRHDGITIPLSPGDHEYVEQITIGAASARVRFIFHTGDASAGVKPDSVTTG